MQIELSVKELNLLLTSAKYLKAEFDYRGPKDQMQRDLRELTNRLERFVGVTHGEEHAKDV